MTAQKTLDYIYHEQHDIHEFKPYTSKRTVIDPYIDILDRIIPETIDKKSPCALIVWNLEEAEIFPLRLQNAYFKQMIEKYPNIPPAFILYLTDRPSDQTLINANYTSRQDTRKVFSPKEREEGIQWLLSCRERVSS